MSRPTFRTLSTTVEISNTGLSPTMVKLPSLFFYLDSYHVQAPPRSLATTCGISVDFFSSGYLDISVPRVRLVQLCIHCTITLAGGVSPFGHARINVCCRLPVPFRRLPRPSSPLTAKASTVCAYSLDHITPSRLGVTCRVDGVQSHQREHTTQFIRDSKSPP